MMLNELFTTDQVAEMLGLSPHTLAVWRSEGRADLPYIKVGRSVRYEITDILEFLDQQRKSNKNFK